MNSKINIKMINLNYYSNNREFEFGDGIFNGGGRLLDEFHHKK